MKVIGVGDNTCDKYETLRTMYPGGQALNYAAFSKMLGADASYMGVFGRDEVADHILATLDEMGVEHSHCRQYDGENGYARIALVDGDRVFLSSNKGGIAKEKPLDLNEDDLEYLKQFAVIHTSNNSHFNSQLAKVKTTGVPLSYDFSGKWTEDELVAEVAPYADYVTLSCGSVSDEEVRDICFRMKEKGCKNIVASRGSLGAVFYDGETFFFQAPDYVDALDTLGAGDSFAAAFLLSVAHSREDHPEEMEKKGEVYQEEIRKALQYAAKFAATTCLVHGAFGHGKEYDPDAKLSGSTFIRQGGISVMSVKEIIAEIKGKFEERGGLHHVYFVACGGSKAAIFPGLYLLQSEAKTFAATTYTSNEFVHALPKEVGANSLVIICSLKATAESVKAVETANAAGAITIAMTGNYDTGMAKVGQYVVVYSNGDNQIYSDSNQANSLRIGFELLHQFEGYANYDKAMEAYQYIDEIVAEEKVRCMDEATAWAKKNYNENIFYVLASGSNYGVAYSMCCCHFEEMQWKHGVCMHTGEYFHGPFETTDKNLPMVLIMGQGRTRALDERCLKFLKTYAENFIIIDFEKMNKGRIDESVAEFFAPVTLIPIERWYVYQMSLITGHDMDMRRYMYKVEY